MLSTPPAMTSDISPLPIARAACTMASRLDPHNRLTVDPGTSFGRPGQQQRHAADVAIVFSRLVRAPVDHVVYACDVEAGISLPERRDWNRSQVVGAHAGERTAVAAKGSSNGVADVDGMHGRVQTTATGDRGSGFRAQGSELVITRRLGYSPEPLSPSPEPRAPSPNPRIVRSPALGASCIRLPEFLPHLEL